MLNSQKADIFYVSNKLVIARLSRTIWPILLLLLSLYLKLTEL